MYFIKINRIFSSQTSKQNNTKFCWNINQTQNKKKALHFKIHIVIFIFISFFFCEIIAHKLNNNSEIPNWNKNKNSLLIQKSFYVLLYKHGIYSFRWTQREKEKKKQRQQTISKGHIKKERKNEQKKNIYSRDPFLTFLMKRTSKSLKLHAFCLTKILSFC